MSRSATWVALAGLAATCGATGCAEPTTGLDEQTYIDVMTRLTLSRARHVDTPADDSIRAATLDEFGVTAEQLLEFSDRHGADVALMDRIWEAIRLQVEVLDGAPVPGTFDEILQSDSAGVPQGGS